jgi:hypothetical protein
VLVAMNQRDRRVFDMYRVDLEWRDHARARNPERRAVVEHGLGVHDRAATAFDPATGNTIIRVRDAVDRPWRNLVVMPFEGAVRGQA